MSKKLKISLIAFSIAVLVSVIVITTIDSKNRFDEFSKQIFDYKLPEDTALVEETYSRDISNDGYIPFINYSAIIIVKSDLGYDSLVKYYDVSNFLPIQKNRTAAFKVKIIERDNDNSIVHLLKEFEDYSVVLNDDSSYKNYYQIILEDNGIFSLFDLGAY